MTSAKTTTRMAVSDFGKQMYRLAHDGLSSDLQRFIPDDWHLYDQELHLRLRHQDGRFFLREKYPLEVTALALRYSVLPPGTRGLVCPLRISYGPIDGVDMDFDHQGAVILTNRSSVYAYEPYGLYTKHASYLDCIYELLDPLRSHGWTLGKYPAHDGPDHVGIQTIIQQKNNAQFDQMVRYARRHRPELAEDLVAASKQGWALHNDLTIGVFDLMDRAPSYDTEYLFGLYTSKNCVTITLVELVYFMREEPLKYDEFNTTHPNLILLDKYHKML